MANGLMGFPQFAPGGEGGLIPSIQMPQTRMSFPTPRGGGGSRAKVPAASYLAPYLVSGGIEALLNRQEPTVEEQKEEGYYERYPEGKTRDAAILADQLYGVDPKQEKGFKGFLKEAAPVLADVLAGAAFGEEGGAQYGATASSIRQAKNLAEANTAARKQAFIASKLAAQTITQVNVMDQNAARAGVADKRIGRYYKGDPRLWLPASRQEIEEELYEINKQGFRPATVNESWIEIGRPGEGGTDPLAPYTNKKLTNLAEKVQARRDLDSAAMKVITVADPVLDLAKEEYENGRKVSSTGIVSGVLKMGDNARQMVDDAAVAIGFDNGYDAWAINAEGGNKKEGREGWGRASRDLLTGLDELTPREQIAAMNKWVDTADLDDTVRTAFRKEFLEGVSLDNVRQKAALLQLAYLAAAANGQTGRTLSDKDLAFHLEIIGYGATQNPGVLHDNLLGFQDLLVKSGDNETQIQLNPLGWAKYKFDEKNGGLYSDELGYFYKAAITEDNPEGLWRDKDKREATKNFTFRNFYERYGHLGDVKKFGEREFLIRKDARQGFDLYFPGRYGPGTGTGTRTGTGAPAEDDVWDGLDVPLNLEDV